MRRYLWFPDCSLEPEREPKDRHKTGSENHRVELLTKFLVLEDVLQSKLQFPWILRARNHTKSRRRLYPRRIERCDSSRDIEIRVIECVEHIEAELQLRTFTRQGEILLNGNIQVYESRTENIISPRRSESKQHQKSRTPRRVEPFRSGVRTAIGIAFYIGALDIYRRVDQPHTSRLISCGSRKIDGEWCAALRRQDSA